MKKFVLAFVSVLLITSASFAQPQKIVADKIVGIVGDKIILLSDISNALADMQRQGGNLPPNAECQVMEQALVSKVLMLSAIRDSLPVDDAEVEAELDQRIRYFISVYGTKEQLEAIAGKTIYQIKDDARESVRENKLAQSMQRKVVDNVKITPAEVKAFFDRVPQDSLPFFESEIEIGQIVVYPKASYDMEKYVMDELANYKKQVESGLITFAMAAKKYSEDPGSKDRDGQYQINRNDKQWDPVWLSAAFRLKEGEISNVVKTRFGYHILQMVQRNGDDAIVRHILRIPPITEDETRDAVSKLDSVRAKIIAGTMDFNTAAGKYTEDEQAKFAGPFIISGDGDTYNLIDELDKSVVAQLDKLKIGDISQPLTFTDERGKPGVRILYLRSKTEPHRLNLKDDYNKIAQSALEEKKYKALEKWLLTTIPTYYIMVDPEGAECPQMKKWLDAEKDYASVK